MGLPQPILAQDSPEVITIQREIVPETAIIGEEVFTVTLTVTGDSSGCSTAIVDRPLDIILVLDRSNSMDDPSGVGSSTRLDLLKQATTNFLDQVNFSRDRVGIVQFDDAGNVVYPLSDDSSAISNAINLIFSTGGTAIDTGIETARRELADQGRVDAGLIMIIFTDGLTNDSDRALTIAQNAKSQGIRLITIGLGQNEVDSNLLQDIASQPSDFYLVEQADALEDVYTTIAQTVTAGPVAASDVMLEHRFDASAFEVVDGSIDPPTGILSGNTIRWPLREIVDTNVAFSYQVRPLVFGSYNVDQGDSIQYNQCGETPNNLSLPAGLPVTIQQPTPTATPTTTITPTPLPTPTPAPTLIPPLPPTATPTWTESMNSYSKLLRCDLSWLGYLLALLLLLFFLWWFYKVWQEYQKPEAERWPCQWIPWLALPLTLILLWLIISRLNLCRLESVYFWRIDPSSSQGQIYVTDRDGLRPVREFEAVNENYDCVGCHAVTSTGQQIAAITGGGSGPVVIYGLNGEIVEIPTITGSYVDWSPDGNRLAISDANGDIVILDVVSQRVTPLQGASESGVAEMMPSWSADGQKIAFARGTSSPNPFTLEDGADIYVVPAGGGTAAPLSGASGSGFNYYPAYSPDGKWLAFTHHETGTTTYADPNAEIFLVPAGGGQPIRLAANDDMVNRVALKAVSNSWPSWSADGEWLAFNSKRNDPAYDLFLAHINTDGQSDELHPLPGANTPDVFEHLPFWGQPPVTNSWPAILALWPFLFLYLLVWLLYWLCCRLHPPTLTKTALPPPTVSPTPLPPVSLVPTWQVAPTLILGVGGSGRWVLTHLKKTLQDSGFGKLPAGIRFVLLDTPEQEEAHPYRDHRGQIVGVKFADVSLQPDEMLLMGQNLATVIGETKDAALAGWFAYHEFQRLPEQDKNLTSGTKGSRQMARAGFIDKLRARTISNSETNPNDMQHLWQFLVEGSQAVLDGKQIRIMIVGSMAGGMSGTLADLAHLARLASETVLPSEGTIQIKAYLTTDDAFKNVTKNHLLGQINTVATAREIQRFQLTTGLPFPMDYRVGQDELQPELNYLNQIHQKRLFDDMMLFGGEGSPETGRDKVNQPWATTLASMADIIALHLDRSVQSANGDYREQVRRDMETRQNEIAQVVVSSAGSFTYRLPLTDILDIVHTKWSRKLFHLFLNGNQDDRIDANRSFSPELAGLKPTEQLVNEFIMGQFDPSPLGMIVVGQLSESANVLAKNVIQLANTNNNSDITYLDYLRRILDNIVNDPSAQKRAPRLGYAQDFLSKLAVAMNKALEAAKIKATNAPDALDERSRWQHFWVQLGFGQATKDEWEQIVELLTQWQAITNRSLLSLATIRRLLIDGVENEGTTVIPGLYRELELRQAEAEARPAQMDQVAVRRYLWSEPINLDEVHNNPKNQRKLADKWYEQIAHQLGPHLNRLRVQVEKDGSIRLVLIAFQKEHIVALDDKRTETIKDLADGLLEMASSLTQELVSKASLADVLPTQFASQDEKDLLPVVLRNWQTALPYLRGSTETNLQDYEALAVVGIPTEIKERLAPLPSLFAELQSKMRQELQPCPTSIVSINDRTMLPIVREYNRLPIWRIPAMVKAQTTYIRNAGIELDRLTRSSTLTPVFTAERLALTYERRLELGRLLNQDYRFLHPQVVIGLQEPTLARLYLLALAAGWLKPVNRKAILEMPNMPNWTLDYPNYEHIPPLLAGWLRFTQNRSQDAEIRQGLEDVFKNPTEELKQVWRLFVARFQESRPSSLVCQNCGSSIKPGAKFCTNCGTDVPPPPAVQQKPYEDQPQTIRDLASLAALTAYRQLASVEEWDAIVMPRSRLV